MLPALPLRRWPMPRPTLPGLRRLLPALLTLLLLLTPALQACSATPQPPRSVLLQALALQIRLTQGQVAEALQLEPVGEPLVSRVRLEQQQAIPIGDGRGLRLVGRFDWRLAEDPIRVDSPFEIYLLRGERGQTWRLARPVGTVEQTQAWISEPLPQKGESAGGYRAAAPASGSDGAG